MEQIRMELLRLLDSYEQVVGLIPDRHLYGCDIHERPRSGPKPQCDCGLAERQAFLAAYAAQKEAKDGE